MPDSVAEVLKFPDRYIPGRVLDAPGFMQFYRQATPIDTRNKQSQSAPRPSRRTGQATLDDLRAIPWASIPLLRSRDGMA